MKRIAHRFLSPLAATALLAAVAAGLPSQAAAAGSCPFGLTATAQAAPAGGVPYTICSGRVPSFDGTPLDVDLTVPDGTSGPLPLMVMLNGWGGSKSSFEASTLEGNGTNTWHWNNAWFAAQGYAVLTYSPRGFHRSCGLEPSAGYSYATDPACAGRASWTHLADRRWEVHDTQYLTGRLVDAGLAAPAKIAVTGLSYGGGQSWLLAMAQNQVTQPDGSQTGWTSPAGVPIRLAAAVPQFTWTDLAQALLDNGRASDGRSGAPADGDHESPIGVAKESYVDGLFALGQTTAQYATADPTADIPAWYAAIQAGEPYEANPLSAQIVRQMHDFRSAYYLPVPSRAAQVPVFSVQGTTDPLFPAVHTVQMVDRLRAAQPGYPVWAFYGDLGHPYAQSLPAVWTLANGQANAWLSQVLAGVQPSGPRTTMTTAPCLSGQSVGVLTADRYGQLPSSTWLFGDPTAAATSSAVPAGPEALALDPIANSGCRTVSTQADPGVAGWTFTPPAAGTLVGAPVVQVDAQLDGGNAELAGRLFDVDPAGPTQTLITRGVYRITGIPGQVVPVNFELWPTGWQLQPGHRLRLELTQTDAPTWRPDSLPSALRLGGLKLTVPVRTP